MITWLRDLFRLPRAVRELMRYMQDMRPVMSANELAEVNKGYCPKCCGKLQKLVVEEGAYQLESTACVKCGTLYVTGERWSPAQLADGGQHLGSMVV